MKHIIILTTLILQFLFGYSQVKRNGIDYERLAMRKCFIIPMDSILRELGRIYSSNFDSEFIRQKFSNQYPIIDIKLKRNGKLKCIIFEMGKGGISSNKKFRRITKKYIKELKYFNINYRDEFNNNIKLKKAYLFLSFDENGKILPKWY